MTVNLVLTQNIPELGKKGDIIAVTRGYARNFLIPKKFARFIEEEEMAYLKKEQDRLQKRHEDGLMRVEDVKLKLAKKRIQIVCRATSRGTLYAALSKDEVGQAIYETYGVKLSHEAIKIDLIKSLGLHPVTVSFKDKGAVGMKVRVVPQL